MFAGLKGYLRKNGKMSPGDQYFVQLTYKQINNTGYGLLNVTSIETDNNKFVGEVDMMDRTRSVAHSDRFRNKSTCTHFHWNNMSQRMLSACL